MEPRDYEKGCVAPSCRESLKDYLQRKSRRLLEEAHKLNKLALEIQHMSKESQDIIYEQLQEA